MSRPPPARLKAMSYTSLSWAMSCVFTCPVTRFTRPNTCRHKFQAFPELTVSHLCLMCSNTCEMWHSNSRTAEDSGFLGWDKVSCEYSPLFQRTVKPSSSQTSSPKRPRRWRHYDPSKHCELRNQWNNITAQNTCSFRSNCMKPPLRLSPHGYN